MSKYKYQVQAQTVSEPFKMPLVTVFGNRDETTNKDSKLVNCFAEKDLEIGDYWVEKRPGLELYSQKSGAGYGVYNWDGDIYSIFGNTLYREGSLATVALGTVNTSNGVYRFVQMRGAPNKLVLGNGVNAYYTDGVTLFPFPEYVPINAGDFVAGKKYTVLTTGTTDWTDCGAVGQPVDDVEVLSGNFVVGLIYTITFLGDTWIKVKSGGMTWQVSGYTDFTLIGASQNQVGISFTATGTGYGAGFYHGTGTGRAKLSTIATNTTFTATNQGSGTGTAALSIQSLTDGGLYQIAYVGTSNFTLIGATTNTVGTNFTADLRNGAGVGTGSVLIHSNFPIRFCKGWAYLDGTLYVMDPEGRIYGSRNMDDPVAWDSLNMIVARIEPDKGMALAKQMSYVIALKEWTTEVFYDAGNPVGSPLAPVLGAKSPYGCASADSVQEIDDTLYWISTNRSVSPQVVRMRDLKVEVVSYPTIEKLLDQVDFSEVASWTFKHGGHRFYGVTIKNADLTLVLDIDQQLWYQWADPDGTYWSIVGTTFSPYDDRIGQHETNGKLLRIEGAYEIPTDDGVIFDVDIVTQNSNFGVDRRKYLKMMRFSCNQVPGALLYLRVTDDDYQNWSQYRRVDLGVKRPVLIDCGSFYRRAWHLKHRAPTPFRIKSAELQLDIGVL